MNVFTFSSFSKYSSHFWQAPMLLRADLFLDKSVEGKLKFMSEPE
jgi:hypothetical protein